MSKFIFFKSNLKVLIILLVFHSTGSETTADTSTTTGTYTYDYPNIRLHWDKDPVSTYEIAKITGNQMTFDSPGMVFKRQLR